jgi:hypothetical protein
MRVKEIILAALLLFAGTDAFGQIEKGDQNVGLYLIFSSKTQDVFINDNPTSQLPATLEMGAGVGYNYFVSSRFSIGATLAVTYTSTPIGKKANSNYMYTKTYGVSVAPEVRHYLPLTDRIYWMVSASAGFAYGNYKEDQNPGDPIETNYKGWQVVVQPIGLEFRASDKISVGMTVGGFARTSTSMTANGVTVKTIQSLWQLNKAELNLNIWF